MFFVNNKTIKYVKKAQIRYRELAFFYLTSLFFFTIYQKVSEVYNFIIGLWNSLVLYRSFILKYNQTIAQTN